jgi:dihydrofolate reductase
LNRPELRVFLAVSIDGCIARADGALDWLDAVNGANEDYGYASFLADIDAVVLGRITYERVIGFDAWPYAGRRVIVLTHRPLVPRAGESAHAGALAPLLDRLGAEGVRAVYLDGGAAVRQGLREDLVDELILSDVPQLLGDGRPLFGDGVPASQWTLQRSRAYASGLVQNAWRRSR